MNAKNELVKLRGMCDVLPYIITYVIAVVIFAICSAISMNPPIPLLIYAVVSCILSWDKCKNIAGNFSSDGGILSMIIGAVIAIFGGILIAPSVLAQKFKSTLWISLSTSKLSKFTTSELNAVHDELSRYVNYINGLSSVEYKNIQEQKINDGMPCGCRYWGEISDMNRTVENLLTR